MAYASPVSWGRVAAADVLMEANAEAVAACREAAAKAGKEQRCTITVPAPAKADLDKMSTAEALHDIASRILQTVLCSDVVTLQCNIIAEAIQCPELARSLEYFGQSRVVALVERCLEEGGIRGQIHVEYLRFTVGYFVTATVRGPFHRATVGLQRPEFSQVKQENLKRALDLFLVGCLPRRS